MMGDEGRPDIYSMAQTVGRVEAKLESVAGNLARLESAMTTQGATFTQWRDEVIRLQERTKTRATLATVLAIVLPVVIVVLLRMAGLFSASGG